MKVKSPKYFISTDYYTKNLITFTGFIKLEMIYELNSNIILINIKVG